MELVGIFVSVERNRVSQNRVDAALFIERFRIGESFDGNVVLTYKPNKNLTVGVPQIA
jgi:hypothetical protein